MEASEVLEHFQWKSPDEIEEYISSNKNEIGEELADVLYWLLLLSYDLNIDIVSALKRKMKINEQKYPVDKAKGRHTKYTNL